jgi:hypothetical protein
LCTTICDVFSWCVTYVGLRLGDVVQTAAHHIIQYVPSPTGKHLWELEERRVFAGRASRIIWVAEICIRAAALLSSDLVSSPGHLLKALGSCRHLLPSSVTGCSTTWGFISFGNYLLKARPLPSRCILVICTLVVTRHGSP